MICSVCRIYYKNYTREEILAHEESCDGQVDLHTTRWVSRDQSNTSTAYFRLKPFYEAIVKHKDELDKLGTGAGHVDLCVESAVRSSLGNLRRVSKRLITLKNLSH